MLSSFILPPLFINNFESSFYATILVISSLAPWLSLTLLGTPQYLVTIISQTQYYFKKYDHAKYAILIAFCSVILSLMIINIFGFNYFFKEEILEKYSSFIYLSMITLVLKFLLDVFSSILTGFFLIHVAKLFEILFILINVIAVTGVVFFNFDIILIPLINLAFNISVIALLLYFGIKKVNLIFHIKKFKKFLKGTLPFFWISIPGLIFWNTDILILNHFLKDGDVINYSILFRIISIYLIFFGIMNNVIVPYISNKYAQKKYDFLLLNIERQIFIYTFFGMILSIVFIQYVDVFIDFWIGPGKVITDKESKLIFIVFFATYFLTSIMNIHIMAFNIVKEVINIVWIEAILNLIISVVLVQFIGMKGVILGTTLAIIFTQLIFLPKIVYSKLGYKFFINNCFYKNYLFLLSSIFYFYLINQNAYLLNFISFIVLIVIFILINKGVNRQDLGSYIKELIVARK